MFAEDFCGDLVDRDRVVETLAGDGVAVGSGEPEGAPAVSVSGILVHEVLDESEVLLVFDKGGEDVGDFVVFADGVAVGIPAVGGDSEAHAEEGHALGCGDRCGGGSGSELGEAERLEEGEGDGRGATAEEGAAGGG